MGNLTRIINIRDIMREDRGINGDGLRIEQLAWMLFMKIMDDKVQEMELMDVKCKSTILNKEPERAGCDSRIRQYGVNGNGA